MRHIQSILLIVLLTIGWVCYPIHGQAADFPNKPITLIVPYPAGGATDLVIRPLAEAAKKYLGQPVVVENRSGGGGAVGVGSIIGKKPDGYLLSVVVTSLHRNSFINKLSFDTVKDVTPVIQVAGYLYGILVRSDSQFKTLKELLDYAKANPGKISYMASGLGTGGHIAMEELAYNAGGIKFNHIPSKGDPESTAALLGGHIDAISTTSGWIPQAEAGKLRLLATYGEKKTKRFPTVPTVAEVGLKVVHNSPIGIVGPKDLPKEIVKTLHDAFKKSLDDPTFLSVMDRYEMPVMYLNTEDFAKQWAESYVEAGEHVKRYIQK
jgi:tripartite-type tricarboxylate transporter receptor subunit TctC